MHRIDITHSHVYLSISTYYTDIIILNCFLQYHCSEICRCLFMDTTNAALTTGSFKFCIVGCVVCTMCTHTHTKSVQNAVIQGKLLQSRSVNKIIARDLLFASFDVTKQWHEPFAVMLRSPCFARMCYMLCVCLRA